MSHPLFWPTITFFYPVGNTSAVSLAENLPPENKADILLLACGDPRHVLYTIHANETSCLTRSRAFDITCCDVDAAVLARNALLFTLLADEGVPDRLDSLWNLFYHMFVDKRTLSMLFEQCRKLIALAESPETWRAGPYGHFLTTCDGATLFELRRVWAAYLENGSLSMQQAKCFEQRFTEGMKDISQKSRGAATAVRSAGPLALHVHDSVSRQFSSYWSSGITDDDLQNKGKGQGRKRRLSVNPTFAFSIDGDKFAVHYGTDPLSGFHLAEAFSSGKFTRPHERIPPREVVRVAKEQFSRWCISLIKRLKDINPSSSTFVIRMYVGDALLFCQALKYCEARQSPVTPYNVAAWQLSTITLDAHDYGRSAATPAPLSFNVIDTSNILDHVGLVNILVVTVPLLRKTPSATLYTEALLRTGDNPLQGILEHLCGDLPTMALLLGIIPSTFISQFSTRSNLHELITTSDESKQYYERLAWKALGLSDCATLPRHLSFSPEDLACFLFRIYLRMFSDEDMRSRFRLLSLSAERVVQEIGRSGVLHYNRRSFALLVHFVKTQVKTDWQQVMNLFEGLVLADGQLITGQHAYQELCCHLHLLGVYTAQWISGPPLQNYPNDGVPKVFRDWTWTRIPQIVTLVLVVPREDIARLEPEFLNAGTPVLQCDMHDGSRQNWFAVISATFGTLHVSGVGENRVGVVVEGAADATTARMGADARAMQPLWRTGAPLIITFSIPSKSVVDFGRNPTATVGLTLRPTMGVTAKFTEKLGLNLTVSRTLLADTERVFVLARRPVVGTSGAGALTADHWKEDANVMNDVASEVRSFTVRVNITDPSARTALEDVQTIPTVRSTAGSPQSLDACMRIGTYTCSVRFPLPVDMAKAKLRVARKSSYIEVVVPSALFDVQPELDLSKRLASLYSDTIENGIPMPGPIHRVNLDRCPKFELPRTSMGSWFDLHISLMFSNSEKQRIFHENSVSTTKPTLGTLVHIKQTLHVLLRSAAGANPDSKGPENIFALFDTSRRVAYLYIIVARMCFDVSSHTVVADAFVAPGTPTVRAALDIATTMSTNRLQKSNDFAIRNIGTDADETAGWFHLLPRLIERCRTWPHKATCAYRNSKQQNCQLKPTEVFLGGWGHQSPLCTCGESVGTDILPKQFKQVAPHLTRAAFSPFFPVP